MEKTLDFYRNRRRFLLEKKMEKAATVIQKAFRRYKNIVMRLNRTESKAENSKEVEDS